MNQPVAPAYSESIVSRNDEIDLGELFFNLWKLRAVVVGIMLASIVLIVAYHMGKGALATPQKISYPIALTFSSTANNQYPSGNPFAPSDLTAPSVLKKVIELHNMDISINNFSDAVSVEYSNSLIAEAQQRLRAYLAENSKTPQDTRDAAIDALNFLKQESQRYLTVNLDLTQLNLSQEESVTLVQDLVDEWVATSTEQGLFNQDISRPVDLFRIDSSTNLIASYDEANSYLAALEQAVDEISLIPGSDSLTIEGKSLTDLRRDLYIIKNRDIDPLREFAYSNSAVLALIDPTIQVRLLSSKRLQKLEHERLSKMVNSYDLALEKLSVSFSNTNSQYQTDAGQGNIQLDQSVINSLLQMGNQLGAVENRKEIFDRRTETAERLFELEKEMAILAGDTSQTYEGLNPVDILQGALPAIEEQLNELQQLVDAFIVAFREISLDSSSKVYSAQSAPMVTGGIIVSMKKLALHAAMAAVMGLMLGLFVSLIRIAMKSRES